MPPQTTTYKPLPVSLELEYVALLAIPILAIVILQADDEKGACLNDSTILPGNLKEFL